MCGQINCNKRAEANCEGRVSHCTRCALGLLVHNPAQSDLRLRACRCCVQRVWVHLHTTWRWQMDCKGRASAGCNKYTEVTGGVPWVHTPLVHRPTSAARFKGGIEGEVHAEFRDML
ncbi:hypothetical protein DUNSADRAFT_10367 [Dunaliella salina]|uniref:Encoded protein n=1 Tax=Dunaliella salina TaxID=3046 RepID=A0ABQ7GFH8_DUNSA|nr:hypothetical protein DUNSADRAFT_10367 [Dunaliella salina]|eukprot:KAF5833364.1 hypothetical protein DUNSADRAFT_10367 [Dunaliella salina]